MTTGIIDSIKPIQRDHMCTVYPCYLKSSNYQIKKKPKLKTIVLEEENTEIKRTDC